MVVCLQMRKILAILFTLALTAAPAFANEKCIARSASALINEHVVSAVTDLVRRSATGSCEVRYLLTVDGDHHHVVEGARGNQPTDLLCKTAIDIGREKLLSAMGGRFRTETVTVCSEGEPIQKKVKVGDTILENELSRSLVDLYFRYQNTNCRLFRERLAENGQLVVNHGVICQIDSSGANWVVVDKW